jgi:hypothetical protein
MNDTIRNDRVIKAVASKNLNKDVEGSSFLMKRKTNG